MTRYNAAARKLPSVKWMVRKRHPFSGFSRRIYSGYPCRPFSWRAGSLVYRRCLDRAVCGGSGFWYLRILAYCMHCTIAHHRLCSIQGMADCQWESGRQYQEWIKNNFRKLWGGTFIIHYKACCTSKVPMPLRLYLWHWDCWCLYFYLHGLHSSWVLITFIMIRITFILWRRVGWKWSVGR